MVDRKQGICKCSCPFTAEHAAAPRAWESRAGGEVLNGLPHNTIYRNAPILDEAMSRRLSFAASGYC